MRDNLRRVLQAGSWSLLLHPRDCASLRLTCTAARDAANALCSSAQLRVQKDTDKDVPNAAAIAAMHSKLPSLSLLTVQYPGGAVRCYRGTPPKYGPASARQVTSADVSAVADGLAALQYVRDYAAACKRRPLPVTRCRVTAYTEWLPEEALHALLEGLPALQELTLWSPHALDNMDALMYALAAAAPAGLSALRLEHPRVAYRGHLLEGGRRGLEALAPLTQLPLRTLAVPWRMLLRDLRQLAGSLPCLTSLGCGGVSKPLAEQGMEPDTDLSPFPLITTLEGPPWPPEGERSGMGRGRRSDPWVTDAGWDAARASCMLEPWALKLFPNLTAWHGGCLRIRGAGMEDPCTAGVLREAVQRLGGSAERWAVRMEARSCMAHPDAFLSLLAPGSLGALTNVEFGLNCGMPDFNGHHRRAPLWGAQNAPEYEYTDDDGYFYYDDDDEGGDEEGGDEDDDEGSGAAQSAACRAWLPGVLMRLAAAAPHLTRVGLDCPDSALMHLLLDAALPALRSLKRLHTLWLNFNIDMGPAPDGFEQLIHEALGIVDFVQRLTAPAPDGDGCTALRYVLNHDSWECATDACNDQLRAMHSAVTVGSFTVRGGLL